MNKSRVILAQELHDGIAQDLVGLGFSIDSIIASSKDASIRDALRILRFSITELIDKVRLEIHRLRTADDLISDDSRSEYNYELMRVIGEILHNISQHSQASHLSIKIHDNGVGGAQAKDGHFGISGMQERIENLNGDFRIDSNEKGTKIDIELELER